MAIEITFRLAALADVQALFRSLAGVDATVVDLARRTDAKIDGLGERIGRVWTLQTETKELLMTTKEQVLADLGEVKTAMGKIGTETGKLLEKVDALEQRLATSTNADPAIADLVAELKAQAKVVDDLVPDEAAQA